MFERLRPFLPSALIAVLIAYFGFHALTGDRGLLTSEQREQMLATRAAELQQVRAKLLRDSSLSADLLEERARSLLGFADPRDYVIRMER